MILTDCPLHVLRSNRFAKSCKDLTDTFVIKNRGSTFGTHKDAKASTKHKRFGVIDLHAVAGD